MVVISLFFSHLREWTGICITTQYKQTFVGVVQSGYPDRQSMLESHKVMDLLKVLVCRLDIPITK